MMASSFFRFRIRTVGALMIVEKFVEPVTKPTWAVKSFEQERPKTRFEIGSNYFAE